MNLNPKTANAACAFTQNPAYKKSHKTADIYIILIIPENSAFEREKKGFEIEMQKYTQHPSSRIPQHSEIPPLKGVGGCENSMTEVLNPVAEALEAKIGITQTQQKKNPKIQRKLYNVRRTHGKPHKTKTIEKILTIQGMNTHPQLKKSYNKIIQTLQVLILALKQMPDYKPNHPQITIQALETYLAEIKRQSKKTIPDSIALQKAIKQRDNIFKDALQRFKLTKLYIKAYYGTHSPQYKNIQTLNLKSAI